MKRHLLIGIPPVESALEKSAGQVRLLVVAAGSKNPRVHALEKRARERGIRVESRPRAALDQDSDGQRHQDVMAEFEASNLYAEKDLEQVLEKMPGAKLVLVLDGVQDPHNLGACLRTADAAGVGLVIMPKDGSAGLTPVARRSAAGAAEVMPMLLATNLARVLRKLKEQGVWLAGTADDAEQDIYQADLTGPLALVMGSEGKGMRRLTAELCDFLVRIPMQGSVSSLNVSVATAVCLFEINRQRALA
ncbi:MAG: 23S rRNA (guanosine(2251)-2'-O)-methyltransferase RlmB [Xanthomonadales bacterium]|jgi:23S rRNA (guanosine2251-2'-O)-methyltransferase|nr:23S rRNA (guanosine(2251)-2'-O)-methyltransferase RlmB [Xanthomonadales bacterium]